MMTPREQAGRGQAGGLAQSLPEVNASGAACISVCVQTPQKPLKPLGYSENRAQTVKNSRGFVEVEFTSNPAITSRSTPTRTGTAQGEHKKTAPSAQKLLALPPLGVEGSPGGFRGAGFSTPTRPQAPAFTPSPSAEYRDLCEYHASLSEYLEREAPEMRARGEHGALSELETLAGKMLDRLSELEAQGAHLIGTAGGQA